MVLPLGNKSLSVAELRARDYDLWTSAFSGNSFWLPRGRGLFENLKMLAHKLAVPQRCVLFEGPYSFCVVSFRGSTCPGCYPVNSYLWDNHCNICDDEVVLQSRCWECGVASCGECFIPMTDAACWLCRSEADNYIPRCPREHLLGEAYERLECAHQPKDHSQFDFFPFHMTEEVDCTAW